MNQIPTSIRITVNTIDSTLWDLAQNDLVDSNRAPNPGVWLGAVNLALNGQLPKPRHEAWCECRLYRNQWGTDSSTLPIKSDRMLIRS